LPYRWLLLLYCLLRCVLLRIRQCPICGGG
jgi:hypothetical protein